MRKTARISGLLIILGFVTTSASQAATLSLVGVGDLNKPSYANLPAGTSKDFGNKVGFGGGALLAFHLVERTSFEIGALYLNRKADNTTDGIITSYRTLQVPVLLRFYLHPMFSVGFGGYWAHGMGNVNVEDSGGNVTSTGDFASQNLKTNEYGLLGSASLRFPITQTMRLLVDARYNYGLTNVYTDPLNTGITIKNRDIQALVGLQFALGMMR